MIEFYSKYFNSNYKSKVNQLIIDIKRLLELENIEIVEENSAVLNVDLKKNLSSKAWDEINVLYNTIHKNTCFQQCLQRKRPCYLFDLQ